MAAAIMDHLFILAPRAGSSGECFPKKRAHFQLHYFGLLMSILHGRNHAQIQRQKFFERLYAQETNKVWL